MYSILLTGILPYCLRVDLLITYLCNLRNTASASLTFSKAKFPVSIYANWREVVRIKKPFLSTQALLNVLKGAFQVPAYWISQVSYAFLIPEATRSPTSLKAKQASPTILNPFRTDEAEDLSADLSSLDSFKEANKEEMQHNVQCSKTPDLKVKPNSVSWGRTPRQVSSQL